MLVCIDDKNNGEKIMGLEIWKEYKANKEFTLNIMWKQTTFVEIKTIYGLKNIERSKFEEKKPMYW